MSILPPPPPLIDTQPTRKTLSGSNLPNLHYIPAETLKNARESSILICQFTSKIDVIFRESTPQLSQFCLQHILENNTSLSKWFSQFRGDNSFNCFILRITDLFSKLFKNRFIDSFILNNILHKLDVIIRPSLLLCLKEEGKSIGSSNEQLFIKLKDTMSDISRIVLNIVCLFEKDSTTSLYDLFVFLTSNMLLSIIEEEVDFINTNIDTILDIIVKAKSAEFLHITKGVSNDLHSVGDYLNVNIMRKRAQDEFINVYLTSLNNLKYFIKSNKTSQWSSRHRVSYHSANNMPFLSSRSGLISSRSNLIAEEESPSTRDDSIWAVCEKVFEFFPKFPETQVIKEYLDIKKNIFNHKRFILSTSEDLPIDLLSIKTNYNVYTKSQRSIASSLSIYIQEIEFLQQNFLKLAADMELISSLGMAYVKYEEDAQSLYKSTNSTNLPTSLDNVVLALHREGYLEEMNEAIRNISISEKGIKKSTILYNNKSPLALLNESFENDLVIIFAKYEDECSGIFMT